LLLADLWFPLLFGEEALEQIPAEAALLTFGLWTATFPRSYLLRQIHVLLRRVLVHLVLQSVPFRGQLVHFDLQLGALDAELLQPFVLLLQFDGKLVRLNVKCRCLQLGLYQELLQPLVQRVQLSELLI